MRSSGFLISSVIFTPLGASLSTAVPTGSFAALMIVTVTGFAALTGLTAFCANAGAAENASRSSAVVVAFIVFSVRRFDSRYRRRPERLATR
jgi:hypothetical protein